MTKTKYLADVRIRLRLAPYFLVTSLLAFGITLLWFVPQFNYLALELTSGTLVSFFHIMKWRTGQEWFQFATIAAMILPYLCLMDAHLGFGQVFQFLCVFVSVYAGTIVALRHKLIGENFR